MSESPSWYQPPEKKEITSDKIDKIFKSNNFSEFSQNIKDTAKETGRSPWEVTEKYSETKEKKKDYYEDFTYITDLHGVEDDTEFYSKLESQLKNPPEFLICLGDVGGTKSLKELQPLFYNSLTNTSKDQLKNNPNISDLDLINCQVDKKPDGYTLKQGFFDLKTYELQLEHKSDLEIKDQLNSLSDAQIAKNIKEYSKYVHFGHYVSNLSENIKSNLVANLQKNVDRLMETMDKFQTNGTKIVFLEGNWDARSPIDYVPGTPDVIPLPPEKRIFKLEDTLKEHHIEYKKTLATLETQTSFHVLAPFDALNNLNEVDTELVEQIAKQVNQAKNDKKTIILDAHGQPNWKIHNLSKPDKQATGENAKIMRSISYLSFYLEPDQIIYGHIHDPIKDAQGKLTQKDQYILHSDNENSLEFTEINNNSPKKILSSFIEQGQIAHLKVSRFDKNRKPAGLGGNRDSIEMI